jgi:hypothetical protein
MARLGTFPAVGTDGPNSDLAWLTAFVRTAERVAEWHASLGVPADITAASLGDVGRHLRLHKRVHGNFGLETWWWLINHFEGALFQLGRLQFLLREVREGEPRQPHGGGWCLDVHIPDSGPLLPSLVDNSFAQAASFFPHHFPSHFPTGQCARAVASPGFSIPTSPRPCRHRRTSCASSRSSLAAELRRRPPRTSATSSSVPGLPIRPALLPRPSCNRSFWTGSPQAEPGSHATGGGHSRSGEPLVSVGGGWPGAGWQGRCCARCLV